MFHAPEKHRITKHPMLASDASYGNNGAFQIPLPDRVTAFAIVSDGEGWEHVSIHCIEGGEAVTPTWDEMCIIKDIFWDAEDCVVQYHPPKSEYVNNHKNTLHLWRSLNEKMPMPPSIMVGYKDVAKVTKEIPETPVTLQAGSVPNELKSNI